MLVALSAHCLQLFAYEADQVSSGYRRAGYILDDEEDSVGPELQLLGLSCRYS